MSIDGRCDACGGNGSRRELRNNSFNWDTCSICDGTGLAPGFERVVSVYDSSTDNLKTEMNYGLRTGTRCSESRETVFLTCVVRRNKKGEVIEFEIPEFKKTLMGWIGKK